jgi:hypothetical protein
VALAGQIRGRLAGHLGKAGGQNYARSQSKLDVHWFHELQFEGTPACMCGEGIPTSRQFTSGCGLPAKLKNNRWFPFPKSLHEPHTIETRLGIFYAVRGLSGVAGGQDAPGKSLHVSSIATLVWTR